MNDVEQTAIAVENYRRKRALLAFDWMATEIVKQAEQFGQMEIALSAASLTTVIRRVIRAEKIS